MFANPLASSLRPGIGHEILNTGNLEEPHHKCTTLRGVMSRSITPPYCILIALCLRSTRYLVIRGHSKINSNSKVNGGKEAGNKLEGGDFVAQRDTVKVSDVHASEILNRLRVPSVNHKLERSETGKTFWASADPTRLDGSVLIDEGRTATEDFACKRRNDLRVTRHHACPPLEEGLAHIRKQVLTKRGMRFSCSTRGVALNLAH